MAIKFLFIALYCLSTVLIVNCGKRTCFCKLYFQNPSMHSVLTKSYNIQKKPYVSCTSGQANACTEDCYKNKLEEDVLNYPKSHCNEISSYDKTANIDNGFRVVMEKSYSSCEGWKQREPYPPRRRLCCERKCSCSIKYKQNHNGTAQYHTIPLPNGNREPWYVDSHTCGNALSDCMTHCRKEVGAYLNVPNIPLDHTTPGLNIFYGPLNENGLTTTKLCSQIGHSPTPGYAIFVEYESADHYPGKETVFLGNLCCYDLTTLNLGLTGIVLDHNCISQKQIIDL